MNVLAADVGGTSIRAALVSAAGEILTRRTAPTPPDPVEGLATVARLWSQCGEGAGKAMVVAGGVRDSDGEITESPNLRLWEGTRPGRELGCLVLNDANGAALGELWRGALRPFRHAIMLTLGTGVG
ncbi:MAG: ROK family protein, partial [Planctomycetota bacterium]|nr:ROK family protein [Planctomycetota bacterium]